MVFIMIIIVNSSILSSIRKHLMFKEIRGFVPIFISGPVLSDMELVAKNIGICN